MSFDTLGLSKEILSAVADEGYSEPTPIQKKAIPLVLNGRDVMASAQTGTGKTAAFALPILENLTQHPDDRKNRPIRVLILTPTRELASQVFESVRRYGQNLPLKSAVVFGGVSPFHQKLRLRRVTDILVATPGRLLDLVRSKVISLSHIKTLVLDEADRMLDMGFMPDVKKIVAQLPTQRQTLLFFATFSEELKRDADKLLNNPAVIEVASRNTPTQQVTHLVHPVDRAKKRELLSFLIGSHPDWKQILIFTRTKRAAGDLAEQLEKDGLSAIAIHGDKTQSARTKALKKFKKGEVRILVATNVAARGIDVDQLSHVINYELPEEPAEYIHRIGRTGRAGNKGEAISLVCVDELNLLKAIERILKMDIPQEVIPGYKPNPAIKPKSIGRRRQGRKTFHSSSKKHAGFSKKKSSPRFGNKKPKFSKKKRGSKSSDR